MDELTNPLWASLIGGALFAMVGWLKACKSEKFDVGRFGLTTGIGLVLGLASHFMQKPPEEVMMILAGSGGVAIVDSLLKSAFDWWPGLLAVLKRDKAKSKK